MANGKSDGTRPRPGFSAWLSIGLALGWLAVLATFVRGSGSLLAAWAATISLVVLVIRHSAVSPGGETANQVVAQAARVTPGSEMSESEVARGIAPGSADANRLIGKAGNPVSPQEPSGRQERAPGTTGHPVCQSQAQDPPATGGVHDVRGLGTGRVPGPVAQQRPSEARTLDLRVLTAAEVASVLRVDIDTIIGAISNGDLPGNRIGNQWRVDYEALVRWLQGTYGKPTI